MRDATRDALTTMSRKPILSHSAIAGSAMGPRIRLDPLMNTLVLLRSHVGTAIALGVLLLIALALTALRFDFPGEIPDLELLLFGWLGVALGRLVTGTRASESGAAGGSAGAAEKVDHILRSVARLLQTQPTENDAYTERLHGANNRLAQHET